MESIMRGYNSQRKLKKSQRASATDNAKSKNGIAETTQCHTGIGLPDDLLDPRFFI